MRKLRGSSAVKPYADREDSWKKIFKGLVDLMQDQQRQVESLVKERKFLGKRILSLHDRWVFDVKLLEDQISQMRRDSKIKDMTRFVDTAKANLIIGMKQKEATMQKLRFEGVDDERADLKVLFDELSQCLAEHVTSSNINDVDVSALKAERDFAWNQFKKTEEKLQEQAMRTKSEVQATNEKLQKLISDLEQSQSSNMEKAKMILALQDDIAVLESDSRKKTQEISRLSKELDLLQGDSITTPVLHCCMVGSGMSGLGAKQARLSGMAVSAKDLGHPQVSGKGGRSLKRKGSESDSYLERPRLF